MTHPVTTLNVHGVSVHFGEVVACDDVNLTLNTGEVHAVVGENGAGKSTLMHVLAGALRPTLGTLQVDGVPVSFRSAQDAQDLGISMVYQNFRLVERLTALENIVLGWKKLPRRLNWRHLETLVKEQCEALQLDLPLHRPVFELSAGEKQKTTLLRALIRETRFLILDEPTAVLTPHEAQRFLALVNRLATQGMGVIFVSHKLPEVLSVANRVSVLRHGRTLLSNHSTQGLSPASLAACMVGEVPTELHSTGDPSPGRMLSPSLQGLDLPEAPDPKSPPIAELEGVFTGAEGGLRDVHFAVRAGEIVALAGVSGNGQKDFVEVLSGLKRPQGGRVRLEGDDVTGKGPRVFQKRGVRYLSEDRYDEGAHPELTLAETSFLKDYRQRARSPFHLLNRKLMAFETKERLRAFDVRGGNENSLCGSLSGGNLQKLLLSRELAGTPKLIIVHEPAQGLDLHAARFVYEQILSAAASGCGIVLVSSDLEETLALAHTLYVLYRGKIMSVSQRPFQRPAVGRAMAGLEEGV